MVTVNVATDEPTMSAHYDDDANVGKLWNAMGTKTKVKLPRMAVVPLALAPFLLEQPRLPNELNEKLAGKIGDPSTTGDTSNERIETFSSNGAPQQHRWTEVRVASWRWI